jgi:hypothetical protein
MANSFDSNFTQVVADGFMDPFQTKRMLSNNVNTQLLDGKFTPKTGNIVNFKRANDYVSERTPEGDISGSSRSDIITGQASGIVQDMITTSVDYNVVDQAIKMGGLEEILRPLATRIVTDLELDFAAFMMKNTALLSGTPGVAVSTWDDVANAGAVMSTSGIPEDDDWSYAMNPFTQTALASDQRSLGAGGEAGKLISKAHRKAMITDNFAGMQVLSSTALDSFTIAAGADRAGTLSANPAVTYLAAKDTMTQTLTVAGFQANLVIQAGETIQMASRNRLNLSTRKPIINAAGANILFTGTVTTDVTLSGTGTGTIIITGPAIFEATGAYNTTQTAAISGDVVTLLGSAGDIVQPNLFWHKQAFAIGSVPIPKLHSTDTLATTEDGLQIRISKGVSFLENKQIVRFDFWPAYAALNPFFAGQGHG